MWWSFRAPAGVDAIRRFIKHGSMTGSVGFQVGSGLSSPRVVDRGRSYTAAGSGLMECESNAIKQLLVFALAVTVCAGTILAMFAWTGASL
jgi:hypothetical protein